jgi:hypothetical protein
MKEKIILKILSIQSEKLKITAAAGYTALVLLSSVIPMHGRVGHFSLAVGLTPIVQNLLHVPVFAVLTILWLQLMRGYSMTPYTKFLLVIISALSFGIINELIQSVIPGRYPGLVDLGLNLIGVILGALVFVLAKRLRPEAVRRLVCG